PETVIGWHRQGFRWYWTWRIRHGRSGRPCAPKETRNLIRTMSRENPLWGAPRIHGELMKLGIKDIGGFRCQIHGSKSEATISNLENIPRQSHITTRFSRLLHRSHCLV